MSYEFRIGLRYLYRATRSRRHAVGFLVSLAVLAVSVIILISTGGTSGIAVLGLAASMLSTVLFALLFHLSVFTTVSVLGVVLGVAALTVVLAVTTGFQKEFREKVLGVNAHVIIMKNTPDFVEYREVEKIAANIDPEVLAVQPFIFVEMLVTRGRGDLSGGVAIKGIDPKRVSTVLDLHKHMEEGTVSTLERRPRAGELPPIIVGKALAKRLKAGVGDRVTVVAPLSNLDMSTWEPTGDAPRSKEFVISGIFYSGFAEYDSRLMYIHIAEAQELLNWRDKVMGVELKVENVDHAARIAKKLRNALAGPHYNIQDWHDLNKNLFTALTLQKVVLLIILTLIIAVAAFNMVSALTMMVIDKTREIAILKSMGSTSSGISRVFLVIGLTIGGVGTLIGLAMGLTLCEVVSHYNYALDPKVYLIDRLPIDVQPFEVLLVGEITMFISLLSTLFPATKASSLTPVEGLRYD